MHVECHAVEESLLITTLAVAPVFTEEDAVEDIVLVTADLCLEEARSEEPACKRPLIPINRNATYYRECVS